MISGVKFLKRDSKYDTAQANVNDMFCAFSKEILADIYVLAHATAPFLHASSIDEGVRAVKSGKYDSAIAVKKIQEFIWKDGSPFNYDPRVIPRTQDLDPLFVETTAIQNFSLWVKTINVYKYGRYLYLKQQNKEISSYGNGCDCNDGNIIF